jgi:hypothetical protein
MADDQYSWFKFTLKGPVDVVFKLLKVRMERSKYIVQSGPDSIVSIELIAEFSQETARKLATYFPPIRAGLAEGHFTYRFVLKDEIIKKYDKELLAAIMPEDLLAAGNEACIRLENFECRGYGNFE